MTTDISAQLIDQVLTARAEKKALAIAGGGSKGFLGRQIEGAPLSIAGHRGIVDYASAELVMTARAGTPLVELIAELEGKNQMLPFEPATFNGRATLGGTLAANISGPARPWRGSVRDAVLGIRLINGLGEHLRFGGVVMKNVAGYDLSRFQAGAMGTLGVITEVSFKVQPKPAMEQTVKMEMPQQQALDKLALIQRQPKPLSAAAWVDGSLYLRLSGAETSVQGTLSQWGGDIIEPFAADEFWLSLREQTHSFFAGEMPLWRVSVRSSAVAYEHAPTLLEWGGALRWIRQDSDLAGMEAQWQSQGGQVNLYRHGDRSGEVYGTLQPPLAALHRQIKLAVDPERIFNQGRLYSWL